MVEHRPYKTRVAGSIPAMPTGALGAMVARSLDVRKVGGSSPSVPTKFMEKEIKNFLAPFLKKDLPEIKPGDTVCVYQKLKEGEKEKIQTFEGIVIARKHGKEIGATITVRREISGIGVEKIFPLHSPTITKIEILKRGKVRRAKLYYLRKAVGKKKKIKIKKE